MAASTTFSNYDISVARVASGVDYMYERKPDPRSSMYVDKGPSPWNRMKSRVRRAGKAIRKVFRKGNKPDEHANADDEADSAGVASTTAQSQLQIHAYTFAKLVGERPNTSGTAVSEKWYPQSGGGGWQRDTILSVQNPRNIRTSASTSYHGTDTTIGPRQTSACGSENNSQGRDTSPSSDSATSQFVTAEASSVRPKPELPMPNTDKPNLTAFKDFRRTYSPGMFTNSNLREVENATDAETEASFDHTRIAMQASVDTDDGRIVSPISGFRTRKPAYTSMGLPSGNDGRVYLAAGRSIGEPFAVYDHSPYASSTALPTDNDTRSGPTFYDSRLSTPAIPEPPFSPAPPAARRGADRHSKFFNKIEREATFTDTIPGSPAIPELLASPDSVDFLENVYKDLPLAPSCEPKPQKPKRNTLKVPVQPRKSVPLPATGGPSKPHASEPDVNKALPPSPGPNSPRRFTPAPNSYFPPRTDSLNNPVASASSRPSRMTVYMDPAKVPAPNIMLDNGYPLHHARASRQNFAGEPRYEASVTPRNPMDEKERLSKLKREESRRVAEAKVKAKREKREREDERALRKLFLSKGK